MRRSLPVINDKVAPDALDLVEIPIPCDVPWSSMPGDEQVRHCGQCKQNVYNVAALTRAEALRLLGARACLRIYRRPDNTILTSDCRERLRAARKKGVLVFAGVLLIVLWAQICAQFIGLMGLKRLWGGSELMGAPVPIAVPGQMALPPPMIEPPPVPVMPPTMGEPAPAPVHDGVKGRIRVKSRLMGKPAPSTAEKMGKIRIPIVGLED
jgi:hypothetical protein